MRKVSRKELIEMIEIYRDCMEIPKWNVIKPQLFAQRSYRRWGATELLDYICSNPDGDPIRLLEEFIDLMDSYSWSNLDSYMFSVAKDVGTDIYDGLFL